MTALGGLLLLVAGRTSAAELRVPSAYPTIQAAVDAAQEGDTVLLADGTYTGAGNRAVDLGRKNLTIGSASGNANACVLDCQGSNGGILIKGGQNASTVIRAITVTNSAPPDQATITGGIYLSFASATIQNCVFLENRVSGIYLNQGFLAISGCSFLGNTGSQGSAGGVSLYDGSITMFNSTFSGNTGELGGACFLQSASGSLTNCTFTANSSTESGGGLGINNFTFAPENPYALSLTNCLFYGNTSPDGPEIYRDAGKLTITAGHVQGGLPPGATDGGSNAVTDPQFVRAAFINSAKDYGDLRLQFGSPAIHAGITEALPPDTSDLDGDGDRNEAIPFDRDGSPRVSGNAVDIGAHEYAFTPGVDLRSTVLLGRGLSGQVIATITLRNEGDTAAPDTTVTGATLAGQTPVSGLSTASAELASGATRTVTLTFPNLSAATRSILRLSGSYEGGTFGGSFRVSVP